MMNFYVPQSGGPRVHLAFVNLRGIEVDMEIGVDPQEHGRVQRLIIDVEVGFDNAKTRIHDSKEGLLAGFDYSKVRTCVQEAVQPRTYLLETIANKIADDIFKLPGALTCDITVCKRRCWANVEATSIRIQREA
jgi:dihydroneopterin aldolase